MQKLLKDIDMLKIVGTVSGMMNYVGLLRICKTNIVCQKELAGVPAGPTPMAKSISWF